MKFLKPFLSHFIYFAVTLLHRDMSKTPVKASVVPVVATVVPMPAPGTPISFKVVVEGALLLASMAAWNNAIQNSVKFLYPYKRESAVGEIIYATVVTVICIAIVALVEYISYLEAVYDKQVTDSITNITEIVPSGTSAVSKAADVSAATTVTVAN